MKATQLYLFIFVVLFSFPLFFLTSSIKAELNTYISVTQTGSTGFDMGKSIDFDSANGAYYVLGSFSGTVDFDPGAGTDNKISNGNEDSFLSKYDSGDNYQWTVSWGGTSQEAAEDVFVDSEGNIYVTGYFHSASMDLDPGAGTTTATTYGAYSGFMSKFDPSGNFLWGHVVPAQWAIAATSDSSYVYVAGWLDTTVDYDPGAGTDSHSPIGSSDVSLLKFDKNGNYIEGINVGSTGSDWAWDMDLDSSDDVYIAGLFSATADFDPGAGDSSTSNSGGNDAFIAKYNSSLEYQWDNAWGGTGHEKIREIEIEGSDLFAVGEFDVTVDFDPGAGTDNYSAIGSTDAFLVKYDTSGNYSWTRQFGGAGGNNNSTNAIEVVPNDGIYIGGMFDDNIDLDPGAGTQSESAAGGTWRDMFMVKLDSNGDYVWHYANGASDYIDAIRTIKINNSGQLYAVGRFEGTVDFDPGAGTDNASTSGGNPDIMLIRFDLSYQVENLDVGLDIEDSSENNIESGTTNGIYSSGHLLRLKDTGTGRVIADVDTSAVMDLDWSTVTGDVDTGTGKSFVHNLVSAGGTGSSYSLYIPFSTGQTGVQICPGATSLGAVTGSCGSGYQLLASDSNVSIVSVGGNTYWKVDGLTGTGGFGFGAENVIYIDLDAQPVTAPSTISTAPEVAISTADEFYISYVPTTSEFASGNYVDIVVPSDWTGLTTCASSTTDADGDATGDGALVVQDTQIIRYTFTGVTTTALASGVEFCFAVNSSATVGNYSIALSDTNDGDFGPALIYVGDDNDVTVTATIPATLSLRIKESSTTADTNSCALGVLNPGSVNSCSYRIAAGTNISTGMQVFTFADNQLNTAGDAADIDDVAGGATVTAGVEEHGILVTLGTGWTVGGSFSASTDEVVPLTETLILDAAASVSDSVEANWNTITHSASVNSGTLGGSYDQLVTYRAWVDT